MKNSSVLFFAFLFTIFTVNGQLLSTKRAKKSADAKAQQRVDNKVDEGIDKGLDGVENFLFGKKKKKKKEEIAEDPDKAVEEIENSMDASEYDEAFNNSDEKNDQEPDLMQMFGGGTVEVAESFEFNSSIDIVVTTTDNKGKATVMNMTMLFPEDNEYFGMEIKGNDNPKEEIPPMKMIYDFENEQMITMMINGQQKIGMVISIDEEQLSKWADDDDNDIDEMPEWTKTGKTKKILSYTCDQYVFSNEDGKGEAWVTEDDDLNIGYAMNAMANAQKQNNKNEYPDGAILEMTFNGEDGEKMTWVSTDIKTDTNISLKTEGYQFMAIGGGQ